MSISAFSFGRLSSSLQVICVAWLFSFSVSAQVTQTLGSLDVDRLGAAVYTLPISAPNGVGGVKPNITALYNSQAANGLLGKGGSIGGLSVIKRCSQSLVRDGVNKAISWTAEDRFCIDTQRLMLVAGTQGVADSQYKTEIDNGVVYTAKGGTAGNPDYFEARAEDGATLIFGGVATAKEQGAATMTWALSQYKDATNNAIEYTYEGTAADGLRIKRINYAFAVPNTTTDPGAYIEFIYRDRDDPISKYVAGYEFRTNKLLTQINSYSLLGLLHRSYQFDLATSSGLAGYVTRLQSVKECTTQSQCFDSTQFEWGRTQKNVTTNQIETKNIKMDFLGSTFSGKDYQLSSAISNCCTVQATDFNGNGIADLAWIVSNGAGIYSYSTINDIAASPTDTLRMTTSVAEAKYDYTSEMLPLEFADINADGIQEVITPLQGSSGYSDTNHPWGINFMHWYWGRAYRQFGIYSLAKPIDLDGDGYEEILGYNQRSIDFTLHKTQRKINEPVTSYLYRYLDYYSATLRLSDIPTADGIFVEYAKDMAAVGDLNNDGKKDLLILVKLGYPTADEQIYKINWYEQKSGVLEFKGTIYQESKKPLGTQPYNGGYKLSDFVALTSIKAVDINGDGLDDVVFQKNGVWMYAINKGDGFLPFVTIPNKAVSKPAISSTFIDVNNDGQADYIYGESTYSGSAYTNPSIYVRYWNTKAAVFDAPVLIRTTPDYPILFADMNGDGFVDFIENKRVENDRTKDAINVYGFTNNLGNATVGFQGVLDQDTIVSIKTGVTTNASIEYQTLIRPKSIDIFTCVGNFPCFDFSTNSHYKPLKYSISRIVNSPADVQASAPSVLSNYYTKTNEPFSGLDNPHAGAAKVAQYVAPFPIVTRVKNNLVATNDKKYYYEVMRTQSGGRGLLGFEKTSVEDVATGIRTETFWRQDWPFTGLPISKIVWNKFNKAMSEVENTLAVNPIDQSKVFKVNVSNVVAKQYETGINDTVQGGLVSVNNSSSSSQSSSSASAVYASEPAILELLTPGERSIKYVAAGVSVGLKAVALSKDGTSWKDSSGNAPVVKFYADDYTYLGESRADGTPFNWMPLASKTYSIKAKVFLDAGVILQSRTAGVVVSDAIGYPTVEFLDTIRNGVKYFSGDIVNLIAKAEDKDGSIVNVKFYANNILVGTGNWNGGNYRFDWTPTAAGVYNIKAIATDSANNKSESKTLEIFYGVNGSSSSSTASSAAAASLTLPLTYPLTNSALGESLYLGSSLKNSSGQQLYEPDGSVPVARFYANGLYVGESRADGYWFQWKPAAAGVYDVVAVSMFNNEQFVSRTATLIVKGSATANIELTAPKYYGARYEAGSYVGISANINDSSFNIAKVIFYANDQEISADTTAPYSFAWMPSNSGIYTVKAVAVDVNGNSFTSLNRVISYGAVTSSASSSSTYSIPSSSQSSSLSSVRDPMRFELTSPLERTSDQYGLGAEVVLAAPVIGADGGTWVDAAGNAAQVNFYANEQLLTGLRKDPRGYFSFWKPNATGSYSIKAVARVNESKTITTGYGTVRVINANAPTVSLVHPVADRFLKLGDSLNLVATASDTDGNLQSVDFYSNGERLNVPVQGSNPFNLLWTPYVTGEYFIRAEAMDITRVKSTTGSVRVTVVNPGAKPAVTLINPNSASVPFGANLTLSADAIDYDGTIAKVEFYANELLVGTTTTKPYQINFNLPAAGSYSLKAIAYDNLNNSAVSTISQIQHGLVPPSLSIIDPDDDCFYAINFNAPKDVASNLVYELYEREVGAAWPLTPVVQQSISQGNIPSFKEYFHDHTPGNFEYRSRVCPVNNLAACSQYSDVLPVFLYANCKSIALPTVRLVNPPGSIELGKSIAINAEAQIAGNAIYKVSFFYGDKLLGVDNTAPYAITWTPTETGRNYLYALAEGFNEGTGVSEMRIVNVIPVGGYSSSLSSKSSSASSQSSSFYNVGGSLSSSSSSSSVPTGNGSPGTNQFNFDTEAPNEFKTLSTASNLPVLGQGEFVAATQGNLNVSNGGANYSVGIELPPAVRNLKPNLSLSYGSRAGNGLMGVGWGLSGLSAITRCRVSYVTEGEEAQRPNPRYTVNDRLCLDGQKLVVAANAAPADDSTYWTANTEYKTELDNFAKIVAYGSSASGGQGYFKVWTKDGRILTYGAEDYSQNSKIYAPNQDSGPISTWALDKVEDAYGNSYTITYERNTVNGEFYPQQINLGSTGLVVFTYQNRAGQTPWGYDAGNKYQLTKVLDKVTTYVGNTTAIPIKQYDIDYKISPTTNRELVEKISECGYEFSGWKCARPLTFDWQLGELGFESTPYPVLYTNNQPVTDVASWEDINGDGYVDAVGKKRLLGWGTANGNFIATGYEDAEFIQIIQTQQGKAAIKGVKRAQGAIDVYLSRMELSGAMTSTLITSEVFGDSAPVVRVADLNNDGLTDLIINNQFWIQQENTSFVPSPINAGTYYIHTGSELSYVDVDADGLLDQTIVAFHGYVESVSINGEMRGVYNNVLYSHLNTGNSFGGTLESFGRVGSAQPTVLMSGVGAGASDYHLKRGNLGVWRTWIDINRDGNLDVLYDDFFTPDLNIVKKWAVKLSTGVKPTEMQPLAGTGVAVVPMDHLGIGQYSFAMDYNKDGIDDAVVFTSGTSGVRNLRAFYGSYVNGNLGFVNSGVDPFNGKFDYLLAEVALPASDTINPLRGDVNNDGIVDLYVKGSVYLAKQQQPDLINKITNGFGSTTELAYSPLTGAVNNGSPLYTPDSVAPVFPLQPVNRSMQVVKKVSTSNGQGGFNHTYFNYLGGVQDTFRGFSGFKSIAVTNAASNVVSITEYRQDWPHTGRIKKQTAKDTSGKLISIVDNNYALHTQNARFPYLDYSLQKSYGLSTTSEASPLSVSKTTNTFDSCGNLTDQTTKVGNGFSGVEVTGELSSQHSVSVYNYYNTPACNDDFLTTVTQEVAKAGSVDLKRVVTEFTPNSQNEVYTRTDFKNEAIQKITTYEREVNGVVNKITEVAKDIDGSNAPARVATFSNFAYGMYPQTVTNAENHTTSLTYDYRFGSVKTESFIGLITTNSYDAFGGLQQQQTADGVVTDTITFYCSNAPVACPSGAYYGVTSRVTYSNQIGTLGEPLSINFYDNLQREVRSVVYSLGGKVINQANEYSASGYLTRVSEPYATTGVVADTSLATAWTNFSNYDALGRANTITGADGGSKTTTYSTDAYGFNTNESILVVKPNGGSETQITNSWTNALGQTIRVEDAMLNTVSYSYDAGGNLESTQVNNNPATQITLRHDLAGNKTYIKDPDAGVIDFEFNGFGELRKQTWQKNVAGVEKYISYGYDKLGRQTSRTDKPASGNNISYSWVWDTKQQGQLSARSGNGFSEEYFYDGFSRLSRQIVTTNGLSGGEFTYTYDDFSRPETVKYPNGFKIRRDYHVDGYQVQTRDVTSAITPKVLWALGSNIDARGTFTNQLWGNGVVTQTGFDASSGRLTSIKSGRLSSTNSFANLQGDIQNLSYTFDSLGNLRSRTTARTNSNGSALENITEAYGYDKLNRLTTSTTSGVFGRTQTYQYDTGGLGNLINRSDVLTGTSFNNDVGELKYEQLRNAGVHAVTSAAGVNYSYDKYGNMTARGSESIIYDTFNKPTRIAGSSITDFYYGPDHELYKEVSGTKTTYKLAGGLYEVMVDGSTTTQKSYVDGVILNNRTLINGTQSANDTVYLHTDHLGSVEATSNALGQFVNRMSFGAWGERQQSDWKPGNPTENFLTTNGFTGHDQIDSHNLIHMGGRVYDPSLGRFLSADIVVQSPYDSQNYNRYSYVGNNPLSYTDPSGYKRSNLDPFQRHMANAMQQANGCSSEADACGVRNSSRLTGDTAVWYLQGLAYTNSSNLTEFYGGAFYDPKYFCSSQLCQEGLAQANADLSDALDNAEPDSNDALNQNLANALAHLEARVAWGNDPAGAGAWAAGYVNDQHNKTLVTAMASVVPAERAIGAGVAVGGKVASWLGKIASVFGKSVGNFANQTKLLGHFTKHGREFGAKSASEYLSIARDVMKNGTKVQYAYKGEMRTGFVQFMGNTKRGESKFAFVGTNNQGYITTLHTKSGKDFWKTLNGNSQDRIIYPR